MGLELKRVIWVEDSGFRITCADMVIKTMQINETIERETQGGSAFKSWVARGRRSAKEKKKWTKGRKIRGVASQKPKAGFHKDESGQH